MWGKIPPPSTPSTRLASNLQSCFAVCARIGAPGGFRAVEILDDSQPAAERVLPMKDTTEATKKGMKAKQTKATKKGMKAKTAMKKGMKAKTAMKKGMKAKTDMKKGMKANQISTDAMKKKGMKAKKAIQK